MQPNDFLVRSLSNNEITTHASASPILRLRLNSWVLNQKYPLRVVSKGPVLTSKICYCLDKLTVEKFRFIVVAISRGAKQKFGPDK